MQTSRAALTWGLALLVACSGTEQATSSLPIRSGVSLVYEGAALQNDECSIQIVGDQGWCAGWLDLLVLDAAREGEHVGVVAYVADRSGGLPGVLLAQSRDGGATWTSQLLGSPPTGWRGPPTLHLSGDRAYLLWVSWIEAPLGGRPVGVIWEVGDPAAPYATLSEPGLFGQIVSSPGRVHAILGDVDFANATSGFGIASWAPGETVRSGVLCAGTPNCLPTLHTVDGVRFTGVFDAIARPGDAGAACVFEYSVAEGMPDVHCVPWSEWPDERSTQEPMAGVVHGASGRLSAAWLTTVGERAQARGVAVGARAAAGPAMDLGPGRPALFTDPAAYVGWRPRWRGHVPVVGPEGLRIYRLGEGGAVQTVSFADSPCATAAACGEARGHLGAAQFALPLGGDEHLVFYVVDSWPGDTANHQWLYASRERFTYEGGGGAEPDVAALYPGAAEMSALERACLRASSCYPDGTDLARCSFFWATTGSITPGARAARDRFLATTSCAGYAESWPELTVAQETCPATNCTCLDGDAGVRTCAETAPCGVACTRRGGTCEGGRCSLTATVSECDGCTADGRAVFCATIDGVLRVWSVHDCTAEGGSCAEDADGAPECVGVAACAPLSGATCDGNVLVFCGRAGGTSVTDCADTGTSCKTWVSTGGSTSGSCMPRSETTSCGGLAARCVGTTLVRCAGDGSGYRHADCRALGYERCVENRGWGTGRCE